MSANIIFFGWNVQKIAAIATHGLLVTASNTFYQTPD